MGDAGVDADQNAVVEAVVEDGGDEFSGGGNRWPRQETLALLKIRSEMDSTFRDSTLKAPLWEHISRKLGELGYKRSAKKCKEKFENVYKYHKRTKDGRRATGKSDKTYRFFEELEAFDQNHHPPPPLKPNHHIHEVNNNTINNNNNHIVISTTNNTTPISTSISTINPTILAPPPPLTKIPTVPPQNDNDDDDSSSWSTASDEELARPRSNNNKKKKRKRDQWKHFFRRLTRQVVMKQEEMQNKFLETLERREAEHEARRARHFSTMASDPSAPNDSSAALISLLQKLSGGPRTLVINPSSATTTTTTTNAVPISSVPAAPPRPSRPSNVVVPGRDVAAMASRSPSTPSSSSSRWPKSEVEALIEMRTTLELKYHESGPKGPLWEEISAGMKRVGYDRSAKRCKEKWENINKYFKKVKDNNKLRPEDSKTCPYFHKLDALYRLKNSNLINSTVNHNVVVVGPTKAEEPPLMVQPERQWPMISEEDNLINEEEEEGDEFDGSDSSSTEVDDHHTNNDDIMIVDMKVQEVVVRE